MPTRNDPRGAWWRKWDLHVHTPASLVGHSYGSGEPAWNKFFDALRALPTEIKVLGINDYIFLDGCKRVQQEWETGALPNIELVLPVVELRIDKFGGTGSKLSRVNFHVIFAEDVPVHRIEQQFIAKLSASYRLDPSHGSVTWAGSPTRESLEDLGAAIIKSVPEAKRRDFGPPLLEGFNNFNVSLDSIRDALSSPYFVDHFVTAIGKTEWADIKWNDGSIAEKKTIINGADLVFTSADSVDGLRAAAESLRVARVNPRLLDCSDAHHFADSPNKDRLGKCHSWIKADPTFCGLQHALTEFDDRVHLGEMPELLRRVATTPTKFIRSLSIRKRTDSTGVERWFDGTSIEFNPGLVAVIGNKGSGKSALLDIVGMLGDSDRQGDASFLSEDRFRRPGENKAGGFEAQMRWYAGEADWRPLDWDVMPGIAPRVAYVPQNLFETICNELTATDRGQFDAELKRVIFSHVPAAERLGRSSLDALIDYRSAELRAGANERRQRLADLNRRIVSLEDRLEPTHRTQLESELSRLEAEHEVLELAKPPEVATPGDIPPEATAAALERLQRVRAEANLVAEQIGLAERQLGVAVERTAALERFEERLRRLERELETIKNESEPDLDIIGLEFDQVVSLTIQRDALSTARTAATSMQLAAREQLDPMRAESLRARQALLAEAAAHEEAALDEPNRAYQSYVTALEAWQSALAELVGTPDEVGSIEYLKGQIEDLDEVPEALRAAQEERDTLAREIFQYLSEEAKLLQTLYEPVQSFIESNELAKRTMKLAFFAEVQDAGFERQFLDRIHQGRVGSFAGKDEGEKRVRQLLATSDLKSTDGAITFAKEVLALLSSDARDPKRPPVRVESQLIASQRREDIYEFIFGFEYLQARYGLLFGGRPLHELSPGEKGALLLVFYLLVDRNDVPLLIDQPEENLDNETVYSLLVPSIKEAKKRRQVMIVTHNPNLAVVCDADQIVCATRDMSGPPRILYTTGAIESPTVNKRLLDVLEGTRPAFDNRSDKYLPVA